MQSPSKGAKVFVEIIIFSFVLLKIIYHSFRYKIKSDIFQLTKCHYFINATPVRLDCLSNSAPFPTFNLNIGIMRNPALLDKQSYWWIESGVGLEKGNENDLDANVPFRPYGKTLSRYSVGLVQYGFCYTKSTCYNI